MQGMFTQMAMRAVSQFSSDRDQARKQASKEAYLAIQNASVETCKAALEKMRSAYTCAPGRFLIIWSNNHLGENGEYPDEFENAPADPAGHALSDTLLSAYEHYLTGIAKENDKTVDWATYFHNVLHNKYAGLTGKPTISRQEALQLGHALRFTVEEMDDFLLRVLEQDDGFSYTSSSDLIEIFCFATRQGTETVQTLKERYRKVSNGIRKNPIASKTPGFTEGVYGTFSTNLGVQIQIEEWRQNVNVSVEDQFVEYLRENAADLDNKSRTAYTVYRNLADVVYNAILTCRRDELLPKDGEVKQHLRDCYSKEVTLSASEEEIARTIVSRASTAGRSWGLTQINIPQMDDAGQAICVLESDERRLHSRMVNCLTGRTAIAKADILILLWYYYALCFGTDTPATPGYVTSRGDYPLASRYDDFTVVANEILAYAFLPSFYQPHLLETAISYSLCSGEKIWGIYCDVMEAFDNQDDSEEDSYFELVRKGLPCIARKICEYLQHELSTQNKSIQFQFNNDGIYVQPVAKQLIAYDQLPLSDDARSFFEEVVSVERECSSTENAQRRRRDIVDGVIALMEQCCKESEFALGDYNISSDQRINKSKKRGPYIKVERKLPREQVPVDCLNALSTELVSIIEDYFQSSKDFPSSYNSLQFIFEPTGVYTKLGKENQLFYKEYSGLLEEAKTFLAGLVDISNKAVYNSMTAFREMLICNVITELKKKHPEYKFVKHLKGRVTSRRNDPAHGPHISVRINN